MPPLTVLIANATLATLTGTETYIIHGNHNTETITALLHFEKVPAVFYCHSWTDWISSPPEQPRILAYVAVDDTCRDRLVFENGISADRVQVRLHGVDLDRFSRARRYWLKRNAVLCSATPRRRRPI